MPNEAPPPAKPADRTPTALALLRKEIFRFLNNDKPEVLCIRGQWGVGKTYTWEHLLAEAFKANGVVFKSYSYVSLFGLDSLDRLKSSVFEHTIPVSSVGTDPTLETLGSNIKTVAAAATKAWKPGLGAIAEHAAFLSINKYIVCIDDLERKGDRLRVVDVLGLISLLKERRKCKVVLILNENELGNEEEAFAKYSEKVLDASLIFGPTSKEACEIALEGATPFDETLRDRAIALNIANIRILKKLERLVGLVRPTLEPFDERIQKQAVTSIALFGWAFYAGRSDLLQYIETGRRPTFYGFGTQKRTEKEKAHDNFLNQYGFSHLDDFDRVLLAGIRSGFFDNDALAERAKVMQDGLNNQALNAELQKPWDDYRDSFDDNGDAVCESLLQTIQKHVASLNLTYIDSSIHFLKSMGRKKEAAQVARDWVDAMKDQPRDFFDLARMPFPPSEDELKKAMTATLGKFTDDRDPAAVLADIASKQGWNMEDVDLLAKVSVDDFYQMFKRLRGLDLRVIASKALEFEQYGNDKRYKSVSSNAKAALDKLAKESPINAQRVKNLFRQN